MKHRIIDRTAMLLTAAAITAELAAPAFPVQAENFLFISEIRLASGENAYDTLEADGYSVMSVGLNAGAAAEEQVYLGYKYNTGAAITNIVLSADVGDSFDADGLHYDCASHVDVDDGNGGGTGCLYVTHDERAGEPLVGLDILRSEDGEELLAIPNDGAEIVRSTDGTPADLDRSNSQNTVYLAQIRDGLVRPYISELMPVTAPDENSAVFSAAIRGYNYYISGDIDDAPDTYTILAYKRTADPAESITNIAAVSAEMIRQFEESQVLDAPEETEALTEEVTEAVSEEITEEPETPESEQPEETEQPEGSSEDAAESSIGDVLVAGLFQFHTLTVHAEDEPSSEEAESAEETESSEEAESSEDEASSDEQPAGTTEAAEEESTEKTMEDTTEPTEPLTGDAIGISGIEYARISRDEIPGEQPYYLYITRNPEAGNPVSMLYPGEMPDNPATLFGTWISGFFGTKGTSNAYGFAINEPLYAELERDSTVYTRVPVRLLTAANYAAPTEAAESEDETDPVDATEAEPATEPETETTERKTIPLMMLTARDGLPEDAVTIGGLRTPIYETPMLEHQNVIETDNQKQASIFQKRGITALFLGVVAIAAATVFLLRKRYPADTAKKQKDTAKNKSKKPR